MKKKCCICSNWYTSEEEHIVKREDGWYFLDETEGSECGPYLNEVEAYAGLAVYVREALDGEPTPELQWRIILPDQGGDDETATSI